MNPICRPTRPSTIAALMLGVVVAACGGSPMSLEDEAASAAQNRAPVHDNTREVIAQLPAMLQQPAASKTVSTDRRPQASASVGCALQADELIPFDAEQEAQQAPQSELDPVELVAQPALEVLNDEPR